MNHKASAYLAVLAACTASPSPVAPLRNQTRPAVKDPTAAMFGRRDETGRFVPRTDVKLVDGRSFGWRIRLPCLGPVEYVETMTLPSPGDWTQIIEGRKTDPRTLRETTISADGKTTVTHDYATCIDGWIEHGWNVAKEDPPGNWTIKVEIAGYVPRVWRVTFHE
jgi:hypothetical protein